MPTIKCRLSLHNKCLAAILQVKIWFQNRRSKFKKIIRNQQLQPSMTSQHQQQDQQTPTTCVTPRSALTNDTSTPPPIKEEPSSTSSPGMYTALFLIIFGLVFAQLHKSNSLFIYYSIVERLCSRSIPVRKPAMAINRDTKRKGQHFKLP